MAVLQSLLAAIYPDQCVLCESLTTMPHGLCGACWSDTPFLVGHACAKCAAPLPGEGDGEADLCDECRAFGRPWARGHAVLAYEGRAKALVQRLKYSDRTDLARPAASWMASRLGHALPSNALLVPVPVHRWRLLSRRYNQSAIIATLLGRLVGREVLVDALVRTTATRRLDGLDVAERFQTLEAAIHPHPRRVSQVAGRNVVIVDDVMTSGATLSAAARAASSAGARRVEVAVLARTLKAT